MAFLTPESQVAAEASECAADQDAFWPYHDLIFAHNASGLTVDILKQFASELGLDRELFDECLDSRQYEEVVKRETAFANSIGVQSTPTFLINGEAIFGAQGFLAFRQVIEDVQSP